MKDLEPYNPFIRGISPVGVATAEWRDISRQRQLPVEIYYPAGEQYRGRDLDPHSQDRWTAAGSMSGVGATRSQAAVRDADPAVGAYPLVLFAHGYSGDRREFTGLCTHIASHGYRVVSADHIGSTFADIDARSDKSPRASAEQQKRMAEDRLGDVPFLINSAERHFGDTFTTVGVTGASLGGWTSLIAPSTDARVRAIVPLCPGGVDGPLSAGATASLGDYLTLEWGSNVAMLTLVGDQDSWLPLYGQLRVFARCPAQTKHMVALRRADHQHFVDDMENCHGWYREFTLGLEATDEHSGTPWKAIAAMIRPWSELMPEAEALAIICGLTTLHMDAHLKGTADARVMAEDLGGQLRRRNLSAHVIALL
jgi:dienelactone hydrolase